MNAAATVRQFFSLLFAGQQPSALALIDPAAQIIASRPESGGGSPLYGTYVGREGMAELARRLGEVFEPGGFEIEASFAEGPQVALHGRLNYRVRATGRPFASDWALLCRVENGLITHYHFYEDTAALEAATG